MTTTHDAVQEITAHDLNRCVRALQRLNHEAYGMILDVKVWTNAPDSTPEAIGYVDPAPVADDLTFQDLLDRIQTLETNVATTRRTISHMIAAAKEERLRHVRLESDVKAARRLFGLEAPGE